MRLLIDVNLSPRRVESLTNASYGAIHAGVHPKVVSERLGHANISVTLDLYSHVVEDMQSDAAEKIGELLFGEVPDAV